MTENPPAPAAVFGSRLVAACVHHGTHHQRAQEADARIVHTCGFDSTPSDLGVRFLQQEVQHRHGVAGVWVKFRTEELGRGQRLRSTNWPSGPPVGSSPPA